MLKRSLEEFDFIHFGSESVRERAEARLAFAKSFTLVDRREADETREVAARLALSSRKCVEQQLLLMSAQDSLKEHNDKGQVNRRLASVVALEADIAVADWIFETDRDPLDDRAMCALDQYIGSEIQARFGESAPLLTQVTAKKLALGRLTTGKIFGEGVRNLIRDPTLSMLTGREQALSAAGSALVAATMLTTEIGAETYLKTTIHPSKSKI